MTAAAALVLVLATAAGLGTWFPLRSVGARLFIGAATVLVLMCVIHFSTRLPLSWIAPAIAVLGVPGLIRIGGAALTGSAGQRLRTSAAPLLNPAILLPLAAAAIMAVHGLDSYSIYSWDEFSSWLNWPREAFAANGFFAAGMNWQKLMYTQGWPMALLYPQLFFDRFDLARSVPVGLVWHAALYGLMFDTIRPHLRRLSDRMNVAVEILGAWLIVLALLAAQATWTLLPQLLLIEPPQIFMVSAVFAFLLLGLAGAENLDRAIAGAGYVLAAGYLTKVTVLGAVPAAVLAVLLMPHAAGGGRSARRTLAFRLALLLAPVAAVYVWWSIVGPFQHGATCLADPFSLSTAGEASPVALALTAGHRVAGGIARYLLAYKLPLTVAAAAGMLAAFSRRALMPVAAGIALYAVIYALSLVPLYAWCFGGESELTRLDSLQRYIRVPLRVIHLFGPVFLVLTLAALARGRGNGRTGRRIATALTGRAATAALAAVVAVAAVYQVREISASVRNVVLRDREPAATVAHIAAVERDLRDLRRTIATAGLTTPTVVLIDQGGVGFELRIARYHAHSGRLGDNRSRFRLDEEYSWSPTRADAWTVKRSAADLAARLETRDVVWPLKTDAWARGVLATLVPPGDCAAHPAAYFLLRTPNGPAAFRCVPKTAARRRQ